MHNHLGETNFGFRVGPYIHVVFSIFTFIVVPIAVWWFHRIWSLDNLQTVFSPIVLFFELNSVVNFCILVFGGQVPSIL